MSESSQLSRSRIAVLTITGVAAACGIYLLYDTFSDQPAKSALHRSNAVHRHRPSTRQQQRAAGVVHCSFLLPDDNSPFGRVSLRYSNGEVRSYTLAEGDLSAAVGATTGGISPEVEHDFNITAVECLLTAARYANTETRQQRFVEQGLELLPAAISRRDVAAVRDLASNIAGAISPRVTAEEVQDGITNLSLLIATDGFTGDDSSESGTHDATLADTDDVGGLQGAPEPTQGLKGLLYHIAEADAKRKAYEHRGIHCEECGERPIRGVRWHCLNCSDFDLCSTCEASTEHQKTHVFVKIKVPLPVLSQPTKEHPLWYPGDPRKYHAPLSSALKKHLEATYGFDEPQIDAHYDQFTCIANVPWKDDVMNIEAAIDRRAFNKALTSERWPERFRPNALYDRMFAFYDTNNDGLIGFEEFLSGLAYLRGPNRFESLDRALQGFDIDGDGCVDRFDFLRLFRAKYEIQKLLIESMIESRENEQTQAAMDTLRSSLPISSVFVGEEIPLGEEGAWGGKERNLFGDMLPSVGTSTILRDDERWGDRAIRESQKSDESQGNNEVRERPRPHSSRFEEILRTPTEDIETFSNRGEDDPDNLQCAQQGPSRLDGTNKFEFEAPLIHDESNVHETVNEAMLRQIIENAFHEMLDPLFKGKEDLDREVIESRTERNKWRKEIDQVVREKEAFREELKSAAEHDPLLEVANDSFERANSVRNPVDELAPTDSVSLSRREAEIAETPLQELLDATGYSVSETGIRSNFVAANGSAVPQQSHSLLPEPLFRFDDSLTDLPAASSWFNFTALADDSIHDPTMPQNRPDSTFPGLETSAEGDKNAAGSSSTTASPSKETESMAEELPPSKERLEILASSDEQDREIRARGGPGKLNYVEVDKLVKADGTRELRGLVTSWLEWASF